MAEEDTEGGEAITLEADGAARLVVAVEYRLDPDFAVSSISITFLDAATLRCCDCEEYRLDADLAVSSISMTFLYSATLCFPLLCIPSLYGSTITDIRHRFQLTRHKILP